jgi:opacity protein-like surface antigen
MRTRWIPALVVSVLGLSAATSASAQSAGKARIGGLVTSSLSLGNSAPTMGVAAGYQFTPWLGVEADYTRFSDLLMYDSFICAGAPCADRKQFAKVSSYTASAVVEFPSFAKFTPYATVGGGKAKVRRDIRGDKSFTRTDEWNVATVGGGVEYRVSRWLAVGLDARFQRILEDQRSFRPNLRNTKRVGTTISYRF